MNLSLRETLLYLILTLFSVSSYSRVCFNNVHTKPSYNNTVKFAIEHKIGSSSDPISESGTAHVAEHLLMHIVDTRTMRDAIRIDNAMAITTTDSTIFYVETDVENFGHALELYAISPFIASKMSINEFTRSVNEVRREILQRMENGNDDFIRAKLKYFFSFTESKVDDRPPYGSLSDIKNVKLQDVKKIITSEYFRGSDIYIEGNVTKDVTIKLKCLKAPEMPIGKLKSNDFNKRKVDEIYLNGSSATIQSWLFFEYPDNKLNISYDLKFSEEFNCTLGKRGIDLRFYLDRTGNKNALIVHTFTHTKSSDIGYVVSTLTKALSKPLSKNCYSAQSGRRAIDLLTYFYFDDDVYKSNVDNIKSKVLHSFSADPFVIHDGV